MLAQRLIERKRDGGHLESGEWRALVNAYAAGHVPDYQMAAFLMACFLNGLDRAETAALTEAMLDSGAKMDLAHLGRPRIDKHSTGGVGDKVSLVLAPLVAACGVAVPMMSGRGLGHTGGTLDKLESIPGFRTDLSLADAARQLATLNCALIGQTSEIAPADRKMYALRDATSTVESIPLIAASIMSKKLAEGLTGLVIDVKRGSGAFLPELERGLTLARTMIELGADHQCPVVALVTAMDRPLGRACGNALEVEESVVCLRGGGPADLREVTLALAAEMLLVGGVAPDIAAARARATAALDSGEALEKFRAMVAAQGGDARVADDPKGVLPQAAVQAVVRADKAGVVQRVEPRVIGRAIIGLGGGRTKVEDEVDPAVGVVLHAKPGQRVEAGQSLATIHAGDAARLRAAEYALREAMPIGVAVVTPRPLVSHRVTARGVEVLGGGTRG